MVIILFKKFNKAGTAGLIISDGCLFSHERLSVLDPKWPQGQGQGMPWGELKERVAYPLLYLFHILALYRTPGWWSNLREH